MHCPSSASLKQKFQNAAWVITQWLATFTGNQTCLLVVAGIAVIAAADNLLFPFGLTCGPFYMLPICLACWRLRFHATFAVIVVTASLSVMTFIIHGRPMSTVIGLANLVILIAVPGLVVMIVAGLRATVERQHTQTNYDFLTGVLSPLGFTAQATAMLSSPVVAERTLLLCFIDLDGFKQINDRYGHDAGDQALRIFGERMKTSLRGTDCFGRIGGDEFAWLAQVESASVAPDIAEKLHQRMIDTLSAQQPELGCSVGALILAPKSNRLLTELMREADQLMYSAKRSGKNQLRIASTNVPPHAISPIRDMTTNDNSPGAATIVANL